MHNWDKPCYVYVIENSDGVKYAGVTAYPDDRLMAHQAGDKASLRYTDNCMTFRYIQLSKEPTRWLALELEALVHSYGINGKASPRSAS